MTIGLNAFSGILTLFQDMGLSIICDLQKLTLQLCVRSQNELYYNLYV